MAKLDPETMAKLARNSLATLQKHKDKIFVTLGSAAASGIPLARFSPARPQEFGDITDPGTLLLALGMIGGLGGFFLVLHKTHEIKESWHRPDNPKPSIKHMHEGLKFRAFFFSGNKHLLDDMPREHDVYLYWHSIFRSDRVRHDLFIGYLADHPKANMDEVWKYINDQTAPVSRGEHRRAMQAVHERVDGVERRVDRVELTARETQHLAEAADRKTDRNKHALTGLARIVWNLMGADAQRPNVDEHHRLRSGDEVIEGEPVRHVD